ncbi:lipopolysaccharide assembly protein LapB [Paraglaciecola sp. L1A13]|uniref:tetratricopeptide repeat protein n=1 Tax=Paraglaciecola sp. L1A13 TaxID=2686359 RepID=UPI00131C2145|nr:tetratricopeptide repeat protein [Paraglaciecola sp. L1A13]
MSVVNKMLRDLEARQAPQESASADYQPPKQNTKRLVWLLSLMVITLLFAAISYIWPTVTDNDALSNQDKLNQMINPALIDMTVPDPIQPDKPVAGAMTWVEPPDVGQSDVSEAQGHQAADMNSQLEAAPVIVNNKEPLASVVQPPVAQVNSDKVMPPTASFSKKANRSQNAQAGLKQSINQALREGNTLIAINGLQKLLSSEPENVRIRKKLASLLFAENRMREAQALLSDGIVAQPQQHDLRLMLARLFAQQGEPKKALLLLLEVSPSLAMHSDFYAYRGALAQRSADYAQAQQDYQQLANAEPQKAKWWLGLGIAQDSSGDNLSALKSYRQADNEQQLSPEVITFVRQRLNDLVGIK